MREVPQSQATTLRSKGSGAMSVWQELVASFSGKEMLEQALIPLLRFAVPQVDKLVARIQELEESAASRVERAKEAKELAARVEKLEADLAREKGAMASVVTSQAQAEVRAFAGEKALEGPLEALSGVLTAVGVPLLASSGPSALGGSTSRVGALVAASQRFLEAVGQLMEWKAKLGACRAVELALALLKRHYPNLDLAALDSELPEEEASRLKAEIAGVVKSFAEELSFSG